MRKPIHVDDAGAVGQRIRTSRQRAGLSLRELAFPGCSASYIARMESGERVASLQVLRELAARLGVSEKHLAWGREPGGRSEVEADIELRLALPPEALESVQAAIADGGLRVLASASTQGRKTARELTLRLSLATDSHPEDM